jgi:hypothetical protein
VFCVHIVARVFGLSILVLIVHSVFSNTHT